MLTEFNSLNQLEKAFPDEASCVAYFRDIRWPNGVTCVHGCADAKVYHLANGTFKCGACLSKFSVRNGTIFEDSKLPLRTWFKSVFLMTSNPKGVSSWELHRLIGITQKSAWFVVQRIRELTIALGIQPAMTGTVEVDEMFVGGAEKWKHSSKKVKGAQGAGSYKTKKAVLGLISHDGELRIERVRSGDISTSKRHVRKHVAPGAAVHTDEAYYLFDEPGVLKPPPDGWYNTGDIVEINAEGYLHIRGRVKRFAKVAGEMVSLEVVEHIANTAAPDQQHAACTIPDAQRGENIILFTTDKVLKREDLQMVAKNLGLPELTVARKIIAVDEIPILGTGKTDYVTLKQMAEAL